jgi:hypothetical protein
MLNCLRNRAEQKKLRINAKLMAQYIVDDYITYYREYLPAEVSVDIAACELAKLGGPADPAESLTLRRAACSLASLLNEQLKICGPNTEQNSKEAFVRDMIVLAHWRAQSYKFEQYTDLWDFCDQLLKSPDDPRLSEIKKACVSVKEAIDELVGRPKNGTGGRQNYEGIEFQHSYGLSVYFPWSCAAFSDADKNIYRELAFARDTGWGDFLELYLDKTRREPRESKDRSKTLFGVDSPEAQEKADERDSMPQLMPANVRNAPYLGRNAPYLGRMLQLLESQNGSMKNPPQSVYPLRSPSNPPAGPNGTRSRKRPRR